jgi:hypothetical protein
MNTFHVVSIGYRKFAMRKAADAASLVRIMAEAMPVDETYRHGKSWYFPASDRERNKISLEVVPQTQLLASEPPKDADLNVATEPRRRGLRITGPSIKAGQPEEVGQ